MLTSLVVFLEFGKKFAFEHNNFFETEEKTFAADFIWLKLWPLVFSFYLPLRQT